MDKHRCTWPNTQLAIEYHDNEWGTPVHNDAKHFEFLLLDGFQAGLSWNTILNKRKNFYNAFDGFDYNKIAKYGEEKKLSLMQDAGIIRNKLKIQAAVINSNLFMEVQQKFGSFDKFIWQFVNYKTIHNHHKDSKTIPVKTVESDKMSKALAKLGFKFIGSTICYAYMQAAGMVNDHLQDCFRYKELQNK